ncbi:MAG: DUF1972 domain-containing protein [Lachnospiraceae bacterium]|nr:DUF1972 domain-containing protein [Lachnospiraceae bacterium]
MRDVFIIGCKGIPAKYGGFETFVEHLTRYRKSPQLQYHVACVGEQEKEYTYNGASCFALRLPAIGSAKAVFYDVAAFCRCLKTIRQEHISQPVVYVLACRIGPFIGILKKKLEKQGGTLYVNPDGHEFLRAKWNRWIRAYWRFSERGMVKHADLVVCDSRNIETYIRKNYNKYRPKTMYISYGTQVEQRPEPDAALETWYSRHKLKSGQYYLVVGRFVPENNYEIMIREFMKSHTTRDLVLITNVKQNEFYRELQKRTQFQRDQRIKFVGTVYDEALLGQVRSYAYGYLHGHEVGGTNPSLLEALAATRVNLLLDVGFNREVGADGALYWSKQPGSLSELIDRADQLTGEECSELADRAVRRMREYYSWDRIVDAYESLFLDGWKGQV